MKEKDKKAIKKDRKTEKKKTGILKNNEEI